MLYMKIIDFKIIKYLKLIYYMYDKIYFVIIYVEEIDKSLVEIFNR